MTDKEAEHNFCECVTLLGKMVDAVGNEATKNQIWDKWGEIEMVLTNHFSATVEERVNKIMSNIASDTSLCVIRYALTRYFEEALDKEKNAPQ